MLDYERGLSEMSILKIICHSRKNYVKVIKDILENFKEGLFYLVVLLVFPVSAPICAYQMRKEARELVRKYDIAMEKK